MAKNDFIKNKNNTKTTVNSKQKPKWSFYVVLALMVVWTIASILTFGLTVKDCSKSAKADTVETSYTYQGANLFMPISNFYFDSNGNILDYNDGLRNQFQVGTLSFAIAINKLSTQSIATLPQNSNKYSVAYTFSAFYETPNENDLENIYTPVTESHSFAHYNNLYGYNGRKPLPSRNGTGSHQLRYFQERSTLWVTNYKTVNTDYFSSYFFTPIYVYVDSEFFTADILTIDIGSELMDETTFSVWAPNSDLPHRTYKHNNMYCMNYIRYYDTNNHCLEFSIPAPTTDSLGGSTNGGGYVATDGFVRLTSRTYHTNRYYETNAFYQDGYNQGLANGIEQGKAEQKSQDDIVIENINNSVNDRINQARQEADTTGFNRGYAQGYDEGANDANQYSFFNLITSVIDVPVRAFTEMFNFELLGVNMRGFYTSLLTIAIIITVIKIIL